MLRFSFIFLLLIHHDESLNVLRPIEVVKARTQVIDLNPLMHYNRLNPCKSYHNGFQRQNLLLRYVIQYTCFNPCIIIECV